MPTARNTRIIRLLSMSYFVMLPVILMMIATILPTATTKGRSGMVAFRFIGVSGFQQQQLRQRPQRDLLLKQSSSSRLFAARESMPIASGLGITGALAPVFRNRLFRTGRRSSSSDSGSPSALFMGRRGKKWRRDSNFTKYPPRVMKVPENGETPDVAMVYPERYRELLNEKVANMERMVLEAITNATITSTSTSSSNNPNDEIICLPLTEVFESPKEGYRMRANFKMWRTGGFKQKKGPKENEGGDDSQETTPREDEDTAVKVDYVMFERGDNRTPVRVTKYPMGSSLVQALMDPVRSVIESDQELHLKINDARFLTTLSGDALVTITYNRPIGEEWRASAARLVEELEKTVIGKDNTITLVGRSRKVKLVVQSGDKGVDEQQGEANVRETLKVPMILRDDDGNSDGDNTKEFQYVQTEGAFSQPNAFVCQSMLGWAHDVTRPSSSNSENSTADSDLCELYCGNGCFTVVLASNFRRVVATEMSKASVDLAKHNLLANQIHNTRVAKLNAEDFVTAYEGKRIFRRLEDAGIRLHSQNTTVVEEEGLLPPPLEFDRLHTLFVDPPRAGLDETCRSLAAKFQRVVYVSCNPETLARDVAVLAESHEITRIAAFDQFPYTPHLEAGVVLERKKHSSQPTNEGTDGGGEDD